MDAVPVRCMCGVISRSVKDMWARTDGRTDGRTQTGVGVFFCLICSVLRAAGGVVMDCDLQDVPEEIEKLYHKAIEGYDVVLARRTARKDSFFKRFFSRSFYRVLSYLSGVKYDPRVANFGIYKRQVIDTINALPEKNRYFPSMIKWVGFKQTGVEVKHSERAEGTSSYNFKKLLNLSLDIVLAYSDKPLRLQ